MLLALPRLRRRPPIGPPVSLPDVGVMAPSRGEDGADDALEGGPKLWS
jgi:hypothetical protein